MTPMFIDENDTVLDRKRRDLLRDVVTFLESESLRKGFTKDLYSYMELLNLSMMEEGNDFYARFTGKMEYRLNWSLKWPLSTVIKSGKFYLNINPIIFLFQREEEAKALIKHEIMHIILMHHKRVEALKNDYSKLAINLAMDIAVNQYLKNLPGYCQRLSSVNLALNLDMKLNEPLENYVRDIDGAFKEDKTLIAKYDERNNIDYKEVHDEWSFGEDLSKDINREAVRGILKFSSKNGIPKEVTNLLKDLSPGKLSWREIIKSHIKSSPSGKRKTVTRRNRRQPQRLDLKGELGNHIPEVIVAIDVSGSIVDEDVVNFAREILSLTKQYKRPIRIILCDNEIIDDYEIFSIKDLRKLEDRRKGTSFSPVFERLREEGNRTCLLIYFTDGAGEEELTITPHHRTLFVVTGERLSLKNPPGKVIYLNKEVIKDNSTYGLEAMRELLHEWAR